MLEQTWTTRQFVDFFDAYCEVIKLHGRFDPRRELQDQQPNNLLLHCNSHIEVEECGKPLDSNFLFKDLEWSGTYDIFNVSQFPHGVDWAANFDEFDVQTWLHPHVLIPPHGLFSLVVSLVAERYELLKDVPLYVWGEHWYYTIDRDESQKTLPERVELRGRFDVLQLANYARTISTGLFFMERLGLQDVTGMVKADDVDMVIVPKTVLRSLQDELKVAHETVHEKFNSLLRDQEPDSE